MVLFMGSGNNCRGADQGVYDVSCPVRIVCRGISMLLDGEPGRIG